MERGSTAQRVDAAVVRHPQLALLQRNCGSMAAESFLPRAHEIGMHAPTEPRLEHRE
jgi:hypothetical protein